MPTRASGQATSEACAPGSFYASSRARFVSTFADIHHRRPGLLAGGSWPFFGSSTEIPSGQWAIAFESVSFSPLLAADGRPCVNPAVAPDSKAWCIAGIASRLPAGCATNRWESVSRPIRSPPDSLETRLAWNIVPSPMLCTPGCIDDGMERSTNQRFHVRVPGRGGHRYSWFRVAEPIRERRWIGVVFRFRRTASCRRP